MTIQQAFQIAVQHHQAGRLAEAEPLYRQILAVQPSHAEALRLLGVIARQVGRHDLAVEWTRRALVFNPNNPDSHCILGESFHATGRLDEAIAAYRRSLELEPSRPEIHTNLGAALAAQGRPGEAIASYRRALQLKPDIPEAHNNLANALAGQGQLEEAIAGYRRALSLRPNYPEAHNNLANALTGHGQLEEAVVQYRRALELKPNYLEAHNNLGVALNFLGRLDEAIAAFRRALEFNPGYADAHNNLGIALREQGQLDEAVAACRRAVALKSNFPDAYNNLGAALAGHGQLDEAIVAYRRAIQLKPGYSEAHNNLGVALREQGQLGEATASFRQAIQLKTDYPEALNNLGTALKGAGELDEAIHLYRRALELKPAYPGAHINLGGALRERGQLDEAVAVCRRALELQPDYADALNNLGIALKDQAELGEAIAVYRRALQVKPEDACAHSNLIYSLHFLPGYDARAISEEHQRWNLRFSDPLKPYLQPHANDRSPERRLRIGYVSPDFRDHPVGRFVLPLFERHDREHFEIFCYSGTIRSDWMTDRLRSLATAWRNTIGVPDARMAELIREDGVDVLVDLAMHTAGNRLPVFARQPAPVQVTWLAYPGSAGLSAIGYRITDARMDPPGSPIRGTDWAAEQPVRLPDCWCCYDPIGESPEINPLPALSAEGVTFGSLNNFAKVHDGVLALWARILNAVKGSRLLILCPDGRTRERVLAFFGARGIAAERLEPVGFLPRSEYLWLYQRIDIGLDPFPCNGMTTTCDALWTGAPVLTLPGDMPVSRAGLSILSTIGLAELAASSEEDYVRIAAELAANLPRLAHLRATLRPRMQASPLMDAPRFARNVEAAYRSIWQRWCANPSSGLKD